MIAGYFCHLYTWYYRYESYGYERYSSVLIVVFDQVFRDVVLVPLL